MDPLKSKDFDSLKEKILEREDRVRSYRDAAQEHLDLKNSELLASAEMFRGTNLVNFVNRKIKESTNNERDTEFLINNDCDLRHTTGFYLHPRHFDDNVKILEKLKKALIELGIPEKEVLNFTFLGKDEKGKVKFDMPVVGIYVNLTADILDKIIEKETEVRMEKVKRPFMEALEKLQQTKAAVEAQTGDEVIDEHPERSFGFQERFLETTKNDIRRNVQREIMDVPKKEVELPAK